MVRVLLYHHFGSQDVLGTDDEPVALYCTFDKVILAFIQIEESLQGVRCCCLLLLANEVAEGTVFTPVCLFAWCYIINIIRNLLIVLLFSIISDPVFNVLFYIPIYLPLIMSRQY